MAKVVVVVAYDEPESEPYEHLAVEVANRVRSLFTGKQVFEIHLASQDTAAHVLHILANRRVR